jgi:biopolymer transport protein ExbD
VRRRKTPDTLSDINVTNLVDVTLVLLIIIMITAPLMQTGLDIQLPKATATKKDIFEGIIINMSKDGVIYLGNDKVSREEFPSKFRALLSETQTGPVYLKADEEVPYGEVVALIGTMKDLGTQELGLITEPEVERR